IEPPRTSARAPPSIRPWSSVCSRPERALPRREKLAALLEPLWQVERNVAEVDEQAAEAAAHLDGEPAAADAEDDRVAELELGGRHLAGRQVDELQAAGHEVELGRAGPGVDDDAARAPAGAHALGRYDAAERGEHVVDEVAQEEPPLGLRRDRPERPHEPGMVEGELAGGRPAEDVGERERHRGTRRRREGPAAGDDEIGRWLVVEGRRRVEQSLERRTRGGEPKRRAITLGVAPRRPTELAEAVAQSDPIERHGRPAENPIDRRVVEPVR